MDSSLLERTELVAFNKIDLLPDLETLAAATSELERRGRQVFHISGATGRGVDTLLAAMAQALDSADESAAPARDQECRP